MKFDVGFIGCGNMGGALLKAVAEKNKDISIAAFDVSSEKAVSFADKYKNVSVCSMDELAGNSRYIVIGVKPQMLSALFDDLSVVLKERTDRAVLITMAAGTSIEKIVTLSGKELPVIRIMPNTAAAIGKGVILYCGNEFVAKSDFEEFVSLFSGAGILDPIDEKLIDAASAVSGCGPAFCYIFAEALADGAVKCGVPRDKALRYAAATMAGSAEMILSSGIHPGALKDAVCSPGGTTIAGVQSLEEHGFRAAAIAAVDEAYKRTLELK